MDLDLLSKILQELVLEYNRVSLPGMGSFIAEKAPSVFSDRARVIHPPFRRILFRPSEIWNDELLENKYAQEKGCDLEVAKSDIAIFIKSLKEDLDENKSYRIPNFGTMRATEQNDYFFVAEKGLFNYLETFGLGPVNIKILPRRGEVESLNGKPQSNFFEKDIRELLSSSAAETPIQEVSLENPVSSKEMPVIEGTIEEESVKDEPVKEESVKEESVKEESVKDEPVKEEPDKEESVKDEPVKGEPVKVEPVKEESVKEEPVKEEPVKEEPVKEEPVKEEPVKEEPVKEESVKEEIPVNEPSLKELPAKGQSNSDRFIKKFVIVFSVILFIILLIVLLVVFKEELRPFWELILYSKEERELLNSSISSLQ